MILTKVDLSDGENAKDLVAEFRRAQEASGPALMVQWASKWGEAVVEMLQDPERGSDRDEADALAAELAAEERVSNRYRVAILSAVEKLEDVAYGDDASPKVAQALEPITKALEGAINSEPDE